MVEVCEIYLFRHGQTFYNRDKRFTGWKDSKLTPLGFKQVRVVALKLKNKKIDIGFQTELTRSKQTLKEVLKFHPECREIITANRMIERSYGDLSGKFHSTIIRENGKEQYDLWHRGFDNRPPGGESFVDVEKRAKIFIKNLKEFIKKEKVNVAISGHGNSIRLFRKVWEGLSKEKTEKIEIPYDNYYVYKVRI